MGIGGVGSSYGAEPLSGDTSTTSDEVQEIINLINQYGGGFATGVTADTIKSTINDLNNALPRLVSDIKQAYQQTQKDYNTAILNAGSDQAAINYNNEQTPKNLKQLIDNFKNLFDQKIMEFFGPKMKNPPTAGSEFLNKLREAVYSGESGGTYSNIYNLEVKSATTPWPGEGAPIPIHVNPSGGGTPVNPTPPPTPTHPTGTVPFTVNIPEGKNLDDLYIRVQGRDPHTGKWCFITWDQQGYPQYHTDWSDPSEFSIKLSDLPHTGNSVHIYLPEMISGRAYFSQGPLHTANPDPQNPTDPDINTKWSMLEFTNDGSSIGANATAVDAFSSPALQMQMHNDSGSGPQVGYAGDPAEFIRRVKELLSEYDASLSSIWSGGSLTGGIDEFSRLMSPKHFPEDFRTHFSDYIKNTLLAYYQEGKGGHSLYTEATVNGKRETLRGQVSADGSTFNFYDKDGNLVTTLPTNSDNSIPWMTGATGDWMGPNAYSSDTQKDLMRDLSALFSSGIRPESVVTDWDHPISRQYFLDHKDLFYQATNDKGEPMYNVYDRAMHEAGYVGYAYDYDDMYGQDGFQTSPLSQNPSFTVNVSF